MVLIFAYGFVYGMLAVLAVQFVCLMSVSAYISEIDRSLDDSAVFDVILRHYGAREYGLWLMLGLLWPLLLAFMLVLVVVRCASREEKNDDWWVVRTLHWIFLGFGKYRVATTLE